MTMMMIPRRGSICIPPLRLLERLGNRSSLHRNCGFSSLPEFGVVAAMSKNGVIGVDGGIPWRLPEDRDSFKYLAKNGLIADGIIPWRLPKDRQLFQSLTEDRVLIVGRRTFEEHPRLAHINHCRACIIVTNQMTDIQDSAKELVPNTRLQIARSLLEAIEMGHTLSLHGKEDTLAKAGKGQIDIWVAGGQALYEEALPFACEIHLSVVDLEFIGGNNNDVATFPDPSGWDQQFTKTLEVSYPAEGVIQGSDGTITQSSPGFTYCIYRRRR